MFGASHHKQHGWRITLSINGEVRDVCGAVDENIAWITADIFNRMRNLPDDRANYWRRK